MGPVIDVCLTVPGTVKRDHFCDIESVVDVNVSYWSI